VTPLVSRLRPVRRGGLGIVLMLLAALIAASPVAAAPNITVTVRPLTGSAVSIAADDAGTVWMLKQGIEAATSITAGDQRLIFRGRQLEDAQTLASYGIVDASVINLVVRIRDSGSGVATSPPAAPAPPWHQAYARSSSADECPADWSESWAQWPHGGAGGWTCERVLLS